MVCLISPQPAEVRQLHPTVESLNLCVESCTTANWHLGGSCRSQHRFPEQYSSTITAPEQADHLESVFSGLSHEVIAVAWAIA